MKSLPSMTSVEKLVSIGCDGLHGRHWYRDAVAQIDYVSSKEGWDRDEFAGVLATMSPRCSVLRNIRMALHFMHHRDIRVVPMRGIRTSVQKFLDNRIIDGQKVGAFYRNLCGCPDSVTLDVWMAYALGIDQKQFKRRDVRIKAIDRVYRVAMAMRITMSEAQACIWTGYRSRRGLTHSPFSVADEYCKARANKWVIEGCSIHRR